MNGTQKSWSVGVIFRVSMRIFQGCRWKLALKKPESKNTKLVDSKTFNKCRELLINSIWAVTKTSAFYHYWAIVLGGWAPRYRKRLGSPLSTSHEKAIYKGSNPILRGLTITMVINPLQVLGCSPKYYPDRDCNFPITFRDKSGPLNRACRR